MMNENLKKAQDSNRYTMRKLHEVCHKYGIRYFYSNYPINLIGIKLKKRWFRNVVPVPVDDDMFDAPIDYDNVLKAQYGEYMKLPPEDKRKPDHVKM
jgi:lipopolysaccharide cholinephosphotransferase